VLLVLLVVVVVGVMIDGGKVGIVRRLSYCYVAVVVVYAIDADAAIPKIIPN